jgi:hypothetical protein
MKKRYYKWLPNKLEALAPWFVNFALKFDEFAIGLGFVAADVTKVQNDSAMVSWLAEAQRVAEANLDAFRTFRDESLYSENGDPTPVAPPTALPAQPATLTTEIIERLAKLVERIQLADNYTEAIGEALGIVSTPNSTQTPAEVKPQIQASPLQGNYEAEVFVSLKGDSDMFDVQARTMTSDVWMTVKSGTGKGITVRLNPTTPGQPEKFLVRVQLLRRNEPYGKPSDPVYVTVTP